MFFLGTTEQIARTYWDNALASIGPLFEEKGLEEMNVKELKVGISYTRMAYERALNDGAPDDVVNFIVNEYDGLFQRLASLSKEFRDAVRQNRHRWVGGYTEENIAKYMRLAGLD